MTNKTDIMSGLLLINGRDAWEDFGAWLTEDKEGDTRNYSALQRIPGTKKPAAVSFEEEDGENLPAKLARSWEPRDITLRFAIAADNAAQFRARREAFVSYLKEGEDGWLELEVPELGKTYRVYYDDCSDYEHLVDLNGGVAARFSVRFREPKPVV